MLDDIKKLSTDVISAYGKLLESLAAANIHISYDNDLLRKIRDQIIFIRDGVTNGEIVDQSGFDDAVSDLGIEMERLEQYASAHDEVAKVFMDFNRETQQLLEALAAEINVTPPPHHIPIFSEDDFYMSKDKFRRTYVAGPDGLCISQHERDKRQQIESGGLVPKNLLHNLFATLQSADCKEDKVLEILDAVIEEKFPDNKAVIVETVIDRVNTIKETLPYEQEDDDNDVPSEHDEDAKSDSSRRRF